MLRHLQVNSGATGIALRGSVGLTSVVALVMGTQPAIALPLPSSNTVSACSGVSLPPSVVTGIMSPVITGVATPTESRINSIIGLPILGGVLSPLNTNASGLLSTAASGAPITLKVLSNSGTVLGPGDPCYSQADAITLTNPAGISIGGNQITGLGDNGTVATAGELNSIAFGNGASTNATATNSMALGKSAQVGASAIGGVALGANSSVTASNSIAIGASALASRGARTNYSALGLSTLQNSVGEVSVGAAGATRQITNVAAGSSSTDAVNVAQLQGVADSVTALDDIAIKYDGPGKTIVTLAGSGGTTITNVHAGNVTINSTDAVNGSQLFATNTNVTNNTNAITNLNSTVNSQSTTINNNTTNITNNTNAIAVNTTAISNLTNNITNGGIGPIQYSNFGTPTAPNGGVPSQDLTLVGLVNSAVRLHNVADGVVSSTSTDAVNGSQLFATNSQIGNLASLAVQYDNSSHIQVTFGGTGSPAVTLTNIANGTIASNSSDAVNGAQLFATNTNVTNNTNAINSINTNVTNNTTAITNLTNTISNSNTAITNLTNNISNGGIGPVQYSNSGTPLLPNGGIPSNDLVLIGVNPGSVRLHNVANGVIAAGSSDAVTGDQLFTTNTNVTANTVSISTLTNTVNNQSTQITNISNDVTNNTTAITNNTSNIAINTSAITQLRTDVLNGAIGPLVYSDNATPLTPNGGIISNDVVLVGSNPGGVQIHNVANGTISSTSTDAVNGSQLYALTGSVTNLTNLAVVYDNSSLNRITLGGGSPVTISNVANATLNVNSTEAVNGSQLFATNTNVTNNTNAISVINNNLSNNNTAITNNTTNITNNTNAIAVNTTAITNLNNSISNGGIGPVQYSDASTPTVPNGGTRSQDLTLVGASSGVVFLHNIGDGRIASGSSDAINGGQLFTMGTSVANALGITYNSVNNSFAASFNYGGNSYTNVQNVFNAIETTLASGPVSNASSKYFHTTSVAADSAATGTDATAIGPNAQASGIASLAAGRDAQATGDGSVAIGDAATARDGKAVSIGFGNTASGDGAVAIGDPNFATGAGAIALGKDNNANGDGATALGNTNVANGTGAVAIGMLNQSNGLGASVFGSQNTAAGDGAIAIGSLNSATGAGALAMGWNNVASGNASLAIGANVSTTAQDTLAIGSNAAASMEEAAAVGNRAAAHGSRSSAFGTDALADEEEAAAFGHQSAASGIQSSAIGSSSVASADYSTAVGADASATGELAAAFGVSTQAIGYGSTALGTRAVASQAQSVALGSAAETQRGAVTAYSAFGASGPQSSQGEVAIGRSISYYDPNIGGMTSTGERQITGLAAGSADTDAVNVSQLRGVSNAIGGAVANSLGGGATYNNTTGIITGPSYTLNGTTYNNVGDALTALSTGGGSGGSGGTDPNAVHYAGSSKAQIALAGANGTTITNVAAGDVSATSTDAVNGAQLHATEQKVDDLQDKVENGAVGAVQYSDASSPTTPNGGTRTNDVTLVGAQTDAPVAVHNVADGVIAEGSTDAVNGGQIASLSTAISNAHQEARAAIVQAQNTVQYDDNTHTAISLGSVNGPVALHNVADGVTARDAVNLGQLNAGVNSAVAQAKEYTDSRIAAVNFDLRTFRKDANAGTAAALAAAGMPQAYEAGKGMLAFGAGTFQGQTAFAAGFSKAFDDGRTVMKIGATYNSRNQVGVSAGVGLQF